MQAKEDRNSHISSSGGTRLSFSESLAKMHGCMATGRSMISIHLMFDGRRVSRSVTLASRVVGLGFLGKACLTPLIAKYSGGGGHNPPGTCRQIHTQTYSEKLHIKNVCILNDSGEHGYPSGTYPSCGAISDI